MHAIDNGFENLFDDFQPSEDQSADPQTFSGPPLNAGQSDSQAIKDLRSLIGDHDLDHFFHDRELICIIIKIDRDLHNYFSLKISIII